MKSEATQRKHAGWPATLHATAGRQVRAKRDLNCHNMTIPAGTLATIRGVGSRWDRLTIVAEPCSHCGVQARSGYTSWRALEILPEDEQLPIVDSLPADVRRLVIAARRVAFEDRDAETLRELDQASEAFADRVAWDDAPERGAA
jgi:hypothetical protein